MKHAHIWRLLPSALLTLLAGCGWHLQDARSVTVRVSPIYLDLIDEHSDFATALRQHLAQAKVTFAQSPTTARISLQVLDDATGYHVSVVSALNEPQQYEVFYRLRWRAVLHTPDQADREVLPIQSSSLSRVMTYNKLQELAMQRQEQLLEHRLAEDLVMQVMRSLSFLATPDRVDVPKPTVPVP